MKNYLTRVLYRIIYILLDTVIRDAEGLIIYEIVKIRTLLKISYFVQYFGHENK